MTPPPIKPVDVRSVFLSSYEKYTELPSPHR